MKKNLSIFALLFIWFCLPDVVSAQAFVPCNGLECNTCHLVEMGNTILKWLIGMLFLVFAVVLAMAGWGLVTSAGNQNALNDAKSKFTNALIGLLIVLGAWLLVDTIMRSLLSPVGEAGPVPQGHIAGFGPWSQVECVEPIYVAWELTDIEEYEVTDAELVSGYYKDIDMNVGEDGMVAIPGSKYMATPGTVNRFLEMREAARADGINLTVNDGYRSDERQVKYWDKRHCDTNPANCKNKVARPISRGGKGSNHNRGVALDLQTPYNSAEFKWMKENGGKYGFHNKLGSGDPWHWSPSGR